MPWRRIWRFRFRGSSFRNARRNEASQGGSGLSSQSHLQVTSYEYTRFLLAFAFADLCKTMWAYVGCANAFLECIHTHTQDSCFEKPKPPPGKHGKHVHYTSLCHAELSSEILIQRHPFPWVGGLGNALRSQTQARLMCILKSTMSQEYLAGQLTLHVDNFALQPWLAYAGARQAPMTAKPF